MVCVALPGGADAGCGAGRPRHGRARGWASAFGFGAYAAGTWWLYICDPCIRPGAGVDRADGHGWPGAHHGRLPGGAGLCRRALAPGAARAGWLLLVPAAWVLLEWWRGWFLSGFPWLSLGYSQTDTWLAGLAPIGGVHLLSAALLVGAGALVTLFARAVHCAPWRWSRWCCPGHSGSRCATWSGPRPTAPVEIRGDPPGCDAAGHEMAAVEPADHPR